MRIHFQIDSPEADDEILEIIRLAKRGCYVENMVRAAVPLESSYTLNGTPVAVSLD